VAEQQIRRDGEESRLEGGKEPGRSAVVLQQENQKDKLSPWRILAQSPSSAISEK